MAPGTVGENQLQRIIRDLQDAVTELTKEHTESGEPVTDDSPSLHKFSSKLEYLLQFDLKEKSTFMGSRKDYWDYFCDCLAKNKGTNDGIRFVKSISELKTSLGKGRAFIRYCLVHQRLADTLQQCLMNQRVTCDWYYARSPFLNSHLNVAIINQLYELNGIQFDVASRGYDLDSEWPSFARRTVASAVPGAHTWRPPSRCSSVNSLVGSFSQQVPEFLPGPDLDLGELGELSCSAVDDLRVELDQSELRQQRLQEQVQQLTGEASELKQEVAELQTKLLAAEKAPSQEAEAERAQARPKEAERLARELEAQREKLQESEEALAELRTSSQKERTAAIQQAEELQASVRLLTEALSLKEQEAMDTRNQLQNMQRVLREQVDQLVKVEKKAKLELDELRQQNGSLREALDTQVASLQEQLQAKEIKLSISTQKIQQFENHSLDSQSKKLEEYKAQCISLMEINAKLVSTVKRSEESNKELAHSKAALENELTSLKASEKQSKDKPASPECEREKLLVEENQCLEEQTQKAEAPGASPRENETVSDQEQTNQMDPGKDLNLTGESRLALAEAQLELNVKEVSRLQEEVVGLRAQLQGTWEERMKIQALHEVTEASRADLVAQAEQLKFQVEHLNRQHVEELLHHQEKEEELQKQVDAETHARANLRTEAESLKEELEALRMQSGTQVLKNDEAQEALHRAITEIAELGIQVCTLTGQNQEARVRCEELSAKLQELQGQKKESQTLSQSLETMRNDNTVLQEKAQQAEDLAMAVKELQKRLEGSQEDIRNLRKSNQRELSALRLQLSEASSNHQNQMKVLNEELLSARSQVETEKEQVSNLQSRLEELETTNIGHSEALHDTKACVAKSEVLLQQKEEQLQQAQSDVAKAQEELALTQKACQDLSEKLRKTLLEKESIDFRSSAEIDDLYRTKRNLEERLVELIREKDVLWQKSDALEFEQRVRAEEQSGRELPHCSDCRTQFSWWIHRYTCKLCGRPFCYSCCSNTVSSQQGGARERCCKDCCTRHAIAEELGSPSRASYSPLCSTPTRTSMPSVTVAPQSSRPDDAAFDIITDEEVNCIYEGDSLPYTTALSPGSRLHGNHEISSSTSGDITPDESEELPSSVQDAEICLLKSGEVTQTVPVGVEEISNSGQEFKELFIKSSCYSLIPIAVVTPGPTISWEFSSSPKSISFSVVYRESTDIPLEQAKVLIPLTRCNSHKETIQGQVRARNPGEYSLIFDNSFSRFISKNVQYRLRGEQTVVYDGSE